MQKLQIIKKKTNNKDDFNKRRSKESDWNAKVS